MSLILPLTDPPPEHPSIAAMKARYARKAERALHDPAYRATLNVQWWTDDLQAIREAEQVLGQRGSLDPWRKTVELPREDTYDQRWRFRRWPVERAFWLSHMKECESEERKIERWETCGQRAHVWQDPETSEYVLRSDTCKLRICPACRRRYQAAALARIRDLLTDAKPRTWQFITLTIRHNQSDLRQQCDFLKASFRRLRQRQLWKTSVHHGYAVIETSYNKHRDEWHPHLHILARTRYIDWRQLRKDWERITGGSNIIDCGYVRSVGSACDYVAKYLGKPPNLLDLPTTRRVAEYYAAIQHARWLMPFGRPPKAKTRPAMDKPRRLVPVGRLIDFWTAARRGDLEAAKVLRALANHQDAQVRQCEPERQHAIAETARHFDPTDPLVPP